MKPIHNNQNSSKPNKIIVLSNIIHKHDTKLKQFKTQTNQKTQNPINFKEPNRIKDPNIGKKPNKLQRPKDPNKFQIPNQDTTYSGCKVGGVGAAERGGELRGESGANRELSGDGECERD
jgi:hypothetical protein